MSANINRKCLFLFLILFCSLFCNTYASNNTSSDAEHCLDCNHIEEKIYVRADQVVITDDGIFWDSGDGLFLVSQLNSDSAGIYFYSSTIMEASLKCPNGHNRGCYQCGGCNSGWCSHRCRCKL